MHAYYTKGLETEPARTFGTIKDNPDTDKFFGTINKQEYTRTELKASEIFYLWNSVLVNYNDSI